jgi:hypothetical protein
MNQSNPTPGPRKPPATTEFGIFAPVGYLVAAFPKREGAQQVQRDLMTGGYDEADCGLYTCEEVAAVTERNLAENTGFLSRLGWADEAVKIHLDAAKEGAAFLLIYAPNETDVERAMNVIRRVPFEFVHRYRRFIIEKLK